MSEQLKQALDNIDKLPVTPEGVVDIQPSGASLSNKLEVAPLSAAVMRINISLLHYLYESGQAPSSDEKGMILMYIMTHATPTKRDQLWRDARDPKVLWEKFIEWTFTVQSEEINELTNLLYIALKESNKASEIINGESETEDDLKKKKLSKIEQHNGSSSSSGHYSFFTWVGMKLFGKRQ